MNTSICYATLNKYFEYSQNVDFVLKILFSRYFDFILVILNLFSKYFDFILVISTLFSKYFDFILVISTLFSKYFDFILVISTLFSKYFDFILVILTLFSKYFNFIHKIFLLYSRDLRLFFFYVPLKLKFILAWLTETFYGKKIGWSIILMRVSEIKQQSQKSPAVLHMHLCCTVSVIHTNWLNIGLLFCFLPWKVAEMREAVNELLKGIVHPKIKILSLITHPHVVPNP